MTRPACGLLGVPLDHNSSFLRGAARGPAAVRAALRCEAGNAWSESGDDTADPSVLIDLGDVEIREDEGDFERIAGAVEACYARGRRPIVLGGDHSITLPVLRAVARRHPSLSVFHVDAHPDLYPEYDDNPWSHASPFARALEERLVKVLVQVGLRTINPVQQAQIERFGVHAFGPDGFEDALLHLPRGATYVTIDLDGLDPSCAPGVSHPEPGGPSVRELLRALQRLPGPVIGADVVELNPARDVRDLTAGVAAKLVKELVAAVRRG